MEEVLDVRVLLLSFNLVQRHYRFVQNSGLAIAGLVVAYKVFSLSRLLFFDGISEHLVNMLIVVDEQEQMCVEEVLVLLLDHHCLIHACDCVFEVVIHQLPQTLTKRRLR